MRCRLYHAAVFLMILPVFAPGFANAQMDDDDDVVVNNPEASGTAVPPPITDSSAAAAPAVKNVSHPKMMKSGQELPSGSGYAVLDAPLYPCPLPGVPLEVGATMITNPAFNPHEMLYPHKYCGLYAPFYYKTRRTWILTPFGVHKHERRVLTGTQVIVKYKPSVGIFNLYTPAPDSRVFPLDWLLEPATENVWFATAESLLRQCPPSMQEARHVFSKPSFE